MGSYVRWNWLNCPSSPLLQNNMVIVWKKDDMVSTVKWKWILYGHPPFPTKQSVDRRTKVEMVSYGREFYIVVALVPTKQIKQCVDSVKTLVMARYVEWNRTFYCPPFSETIRWYLIAERRLTWFVHSSANNSCKATVYPKNPYVDSVFRPATPTKYYVDNLKKVTLQNNTLIMVKKSWHGNLC